MLADGLSGEQVERLTRAFERQNETLGDARYVEVESDSDEENLLDEADPEVAQRLIRKDPKMKMYHQMAQVRKYIRPWAFAQKRLFVLIFGVFCFFFFLFLFCFVTSFFFFAANLHAR